MFIQSHPGSSGPLKGADWRRPACLAFWLAPDSVEGRQSWPLSLAPYLPLTWFLCWWFLCSVLKLRKHSKFCLGRLWEVWISSRLYKSITKSTRRNSLSHPFLQISPQRVCICFVPTFYRRRLQDHILCHTQHLQRNRAPPEYSWRRPQSWDYHLALACDQFQSDWFPGSVEFVGP